MADENLEQNRPAEESKKDTVRINLPPGLTGRGGPGAGAPGAASAIADGQTQGPGYSRQSRR